MACEKMPTLTCAPKRTEANAPETRRKEVRHNRPEAAGKMQLNKKNKKKG